MEITRLNRWEWAGVAIALCLLVYWLLDSTGAIGDWTSGSTVTYTSYDGPALVSADGRSISVGGFSYPCFGSVALDARESTTQVTLRLKWTTPNHHGVCNKAMAMVTDLQATLSAPLRHRALVDATTGQAIPWFDGSRVLRPTQLPSGYVPIYTSPLFPGFAAGLPSDPPRPGYMQEYRSQAGDGLLTVIGVLGPLRNAAPAIEPVHITVGVRGHTGQADTHSLRWTENDQSVYMSLAMPGQRTPAQTAAELVAIADSAP